MKLVLDGEQRAFIDSVRSVLKDSCSLVRLTQIEDSSSGLDEDLWSKMVRFGWPAMAVPESFGGLGTSLETICTIVQEIGKFGCATPLIPGLQVASICANFDNDDRVKKLYRNLVDGDVATYAGFFDAKVNVERQGDEFLLSADSVPVLWGHLARVIVVAARDAHDVFSVHLIDLKDAGLSLRPAKALDNEPLGILELMRFNAGEPLVVFNSQAALDDWLAPLRAVQAALLTGCALKLLEMTVEYVGIRKQFGRTLGSLPTVHQVLADVSIDVDGARYAVGEAAARLDRGLAGERITAVASYWAGVAAQTTAIRVAQLHGAIGFMKEFPLQLLFRRAKAGQLRLGSVRAQQDMLARLLLPVVGSGDARIAIDGIQLNERG